MKRNDREDFEQKYKELKQTCLALQSKNQKLELENLSLKKGDGIVKVKELVATKPPGYEHDIKELKLLRREVKKLRNIISYGNISTVGKLISEFKILAAAKMEELSREMLCYITSRQDIAEIRDFLDYLEDLRTNLNSLVINLESFKEEEREADAGDH